MQGYGWLNVVHRMAGKDVLKWPQVFELNSVEFLNYVQYLNDLDKAEEQMRNKKP